MSIVKYKNKKTGVITWYESTSHYDPETKQSRPIRKYLGKEDPVTGELIPSSGKRGRKSGSSASQDAPQAGSSMKEASGTAYSSRIQELEEQCRKQQERIASLETENRKLRDTVHKSQAFVDQLCSLYHSAITDKN